MLRWIRRYSAAPSSNDSRQTSENRSRRTRHDLRRVSEPPPPATVFPAAISATSAPSSRAPIHEASQNVPADALSQLEPSAEAATRTEAFAADILVKPEGKTIETSERYRSYRSVNSMTNKFHALISNVREELQCPICLDEFSMPRQLSCGHSYCTQCLHAITPRHSAQLKCPQCRRPTKLMNLKVEDLPLNYPLIQIQEIMKSTDPHVLPCRVHRGEEIRFYCFTCDEMLCAECLCQPVGGENPDMSPDYHDASEDIAIPTVEDEEGSSSLSPLKHIIESTREADTAAVYRHAGHKVTTLKLATRELFSDIKLNTIEGQQKLTLAKSFEEKMNQHKNTVEKQCRKLMDRVDEEFQKLQDTLELRKAQVRNEITRLQDIEIERWEDMAAKAHDYECELSAVLEQSRRLIQSHDAALSKRIDVKGKAAVKHADGIKSRDVYTIWKEGPEIRRQLKLLNEYHPTAHGEPEALQFVDCVFRQSEVVRFEEHLQNIAAVATTDDPHIDKQVNLRGVNGNTTTCALRMWQTEVEDLQNEIEAVMKIPVSLQKIFHNGEVISADPSLKLSKLGICQDAICHVGLDIESPSYDFRTRSSSMNNSSTACDNGHVN